MSRARTAGAKPVSADVAPAPHRVLVVDDVPGIHEMLATALTHYGYEVASASDGPEALSRFIEHRPDAVLVDVLMPGMDGYEVCRRLRELSDVPIIMISALKEEQHIIRGLDAGADDYVTKPFRVSELAARVRAHLRRQRRPEMAQRRLVFDSGRLTVDLDSHLVTSGSSPIRLSPTEFRLLSYLAINAGRVVPHRELTEQVWGADGQRLSPYLKIYIRRLRQKVEPDPEQPRYIISRHGAGYAFQPQTAPVLN